MPGQMGNVRKTIKSLRVAAVDTENNLLMIRGAVPGAHLVDVYAALAARGVALPAGSCPTVGVGGLALGGGIGVIGRKFGLTCDTMASARIVTAGPRGHTRIAGHAG